MIRLNAVDERRFGRQSYRTNATLPPNRWLYRMVEPKAGLSHIASRLRETVPFSTNKGKHTIEQLR